MGLVLVLDQQPTKRWDKLGCLLTVTRRYVSPFVDFEVVGG